MVKTFHILNDEQGSIIIFALMMLVLLTMLGVAASRTSNTEVQIAANEFVYNRNFYQAEGAAMEAVDLLESNPNPKDKRPDWLEPVIGGIDEGDLNDYWEKTEASEGTIPGSSVVDPTGNTRYVAIPVGVVPGNSLGMGQSRVHGYTIYGRCEDNGKVMIKVGYLKAF